MPASSSTDSRSSTTRVSFPGGLLVSIAHQGLQQGHRLVPGPLEV